MAPNSTTPPGVRTVLLAEDDPRMLRALARTVSQHDEFVIVGEAADGCAAVEACTELRPDLVLMDIEMPRMTGIEATRQIVQRYPETKVIALTAHPSAAHVLPMLRAGASGYILKTFARAELFDAMRSVLSGAGQRAISPALVDLLIEYSTADLRDRSSQVVLPDGSTLELTNRESQVVAWLGRGLSNRAIAKEMNVSEGSVKTYLHNVATKLGVSDRLQVLIRCYDLGLVNPTLSPTDLPD